MQPSGSEGVGAGEAVHWFQLSAVCILLYKKTFSKDPWMTGACGLVQRICDFLEPQIHDSVFK